MTVFSSELAWQQVQAHDAGGDGEFVYAVRSTGIYCRPSCPSRRPARRSVVFYPSPAEARAAGYRACKRCRPDAMHPQVSAVAVACRYLDQPHEKPPTLAQMGYAVGMSPYALQRLFRKILGITPRQYFATQQAKRLRRELAASASVTSAMYEAGYGSPSRVYGQSGSQLGMTPAAYRRRGAGQEIRYTLASTQLGRMLVAATARGVCAVAFAESDEALIAGLEREFEQADLKRDDDALASRLATVLTQLSEHPIGAALPLDIRATAFQWRVWQVLQQIPRGQTRSYQEIAQTLDQPTAARAVARACSQNPVALLIPCHRVVGKKGQLTGYRWGLGRKQTLLEMERNSPFFDSLEK